MRVIVWQRNQNGESEDNLQRSEQLATRGEANEGQRQTSELGARAAGEGRMDCVPWRRRAALRSTPARYRLKLYNV